MAQRATSPDPKPSLFLIFFWGVLFSLLSLALLFIFLCLPFFLFSLFWPPPFHFLFLCLFLVLSFLPSFLPVYHVSFWFLSLFFVLFAFCFKMLFALLFCLLSFLVLNHNIIYSCFASCFLVVAVVFCFCCFGVCYFLNLANLSANISQNFGNSENPKNKNAEKKTIFWQEQLAQVCSQIVFLCVF